ncbi:DEAD/DEAH box helicase [Rhodotorula diobovata]|uniref:DEAD/DEAH box helicase n=1 Tax=Rhodotorula diobovata TaxID=5288 RepID=A0A5C5G0H2_9BASI|nr:DEAD/DEAH box helicase [Rhodotorula diobovata]
MAEVHEVAQSDTQQKLSASQALNTLDSTWFIAQYPRWMDVLIYSGQELFILDGDALLQFVLDDPLLAFARTGDPSLQLLHATYLLEKTVDDLLKKDTMFEIVFFESQAHASIHTGAPAYVAAARRLARSILIRRANLPDTKVHRFQSLEDDEWKAWYQRKRPMYVLGHDGGLQTHEGELQAERILIQRQALYDTVHQSLPYVLLQAAELTDTKINAYFYDVVRGTVAGLPENIVAAVDSARSALASAVPALPEVSSAPASASADEVLRSAAATFLASSPSAQESTLLYLYLSHALLLPSVPLRARAQRIPQPSAELMSNLLEPFLAKFYASLTAAVEALPASEAQNPLADFDLDGRIFFILLAEVLNNADLAPEKLADFLGPDVASRLESLWSSLSGAAKPDFGALRSAAPAQSTELPPVPETLTEETVLPYTQSIFTAHLSSVHVAVAPDSTLATLPNRLANESVFSDERGWENPRPALPTHLGGPPPPVLDYRAKKKRDRKEQRFMAQMQKSAASLTGAFGASLKPQTIPSVGKRSGPTLKQQVAAIASAKASRAGTPDASGTVTPTGSEVGRDGGSTTGGRGSKRDKPKVLSSREKLIAENAAKKVQEEGKENYKWWVERLDDLKDMPIPGQISQVQSYLKNKRAQDPWLGTEMVVKRVDLELRKWIADERREADDVADQYRVFIARTLSPLLQKYMRALEEGTGNVVINEKQGRAISNTLAVLGLECLMPEGIKWSDKLGSGDDKKDKKSKADDDDGKKKKGGAKPGSKAAQAAKKDATSSAKAAKPEKDERSKLTFHFCTIIDKDAGEAMYEWMEIDEHPLEWQLRTMGEYMARELDSRPDPRVNFEPDAWQREVLDNIDEDKSMLIVAPTSSGKTFISFAAMERVLRESDEGVVVYVAPSKALVNQVAAECFARFSKDVPGQALWSVHTGDYRINNPQNCQILVTVPQVFSEMLLNPALSRVWTPRIRRVIVDEIHAIAEEGSGMWEQVLLMNPAPIIGLSATVGAPERFSAWLQSVEERCGREYALVIHTHRFNALRKFAYAPRLSKFPDKEISPLNEYRSHPSIFAPVHPIASLALGDPELPEDLALEPRDCLALWRAMSTVDKELDPKLKPRKFFAPTPTIAIKHVIEFERQLKKILVEWRNEPDYASPSSRFSRTVEFLEKPLREALGVSEKLIENATEDEFNSLFTPLLADLNAQNQLPAILFNFSRDHCESLAKRISQDLERAEDKWRKSSPTFKDRLARARAAEKAAAKKAKAAESQTVNRKQEEEAARMGVVEEVQAFDPEAPSEEFTFVGKGISLIEFKKDVDDLLFLDMDPWIINALRRGVGVHHSGLPRRYRVLVENLYRRGVLRVVISTQTLALGINAPARTAVFAGDSLELNPLNFRQCAGRAGRRGFDLVGNVLFVGVRLDRIQRLLLSKLPKLGGTFPLTTTLLLRLNNLIYGSRPEEEEDTRKKRKYEEEDTTPDLPKMSVETLLDLPQLAVSHASVTGNREQTRHFARFAIEYLRRSGLLDEDGTPKTLYGVTSALYPEEPSNFALAALLRSGELHKVAAGIDSKPDETLQTMLLTLAWLFGRVHRRKQSPETVRKTRNSTSLIVLPQLPPQIRAVLDAHHRSVLSVFSTYAKEFAQQNPDKLGSDDVLPLSARKAVGSSEAADSAFASKLRQTELAFESRSAFAALSGHGDDFASVNELSRTARAGVVLYNHAVPELASPPFDSAEHDLDAFVLDFYRHGNLETLIRESSIERGDVWFRLQDFDRALGGIHSAFKALYNRKGDNVADDEMDDARDAKEDRRDAGGDADKEHVLVRPPGISNDDWALYRVIDTLYNEFHTAFYAIFA